VPGPVLSIWDESGLRSIPTLLLWTVVAVVCVIASGICLRTSHEANLVSEAWSAMQAAFQFSNEQLAAFWGQGLLVAEHRPWELNTHPGWAMFWDLGFIAGWGYLLGRVASRAFAWKAGSRTVASDRPRWLLFLGFAPMTAVLGDLSEDLCLWASLACNWAHAGPVALAFLWLGSLGSIAKYFGILASIPLLLLRIWAWPKPAQPRGQAQVATS
jgi:hypothetical protein